MNISKVFTTLKPQIRARLNISAANVKPYEDIPHPKGYPLVGNLPIYLNPQNPRRAMKMIQELRKQHGDIIRMKMPGQGNDVVYVCHPDDGRTLLNSDGPYPLQPSFQRIGQLRE